MRHVPWIFVVLLIAGCTASPERVFRRATAAFERGDVAEGMECFSRRLAATLQRPNLEYYYSRPENREGVAFMLEGAVFQLLESNDETAIARVIWRTGKTEPLHFVREDGAWKIDTAPSAAPENTTQR